MTLHGRALRIALMLVAALVLVEVATHAALVPVSRDLDRLRSFDDRAHSLATAPAPRIAFIGNSVTDRVQPELMRAEWAALTGDSLAVDKFVAYSSNLATWYWISEHFFWKPGVKLDLIVMTYYDAMGLADSEVMDVGNIARFFTDRDDRPALFEHDLKTLPQRADYLLSTVSLAFAMRERIRDRSLNQIPGYQKFATTTNEFNFKYEQEHAAPAIRPDPTYHTLRRFVARAQQEGVLVCFVAFRPRPSGSPASPAYELQPEALRLIAGSGMLHLDLRRMEELSASMYEDAVHLNELGTPVYSRRLTRELARVLRPGHPTAGRLPAKMTYSRNAGTGQSPDRQ